MMNRLHLTAVQLDHLRTHLLQNHREQVAFAFAAVSETQGTRSFGAGELYLVPPEDFTIQTEYHVELTDAALAKLIKMAWDRRAAIVDFHSHPRAMKPAIFSPSDLFGFADLVPHASWRLKGQPYVGVVMAPKTFDALVWPGKFDAPEQLDAVIVDGGDRLIPTGISYSRFNSIARRFTI